MTTLAITPNWKNKSAKFRGTIAAGEHVAVSITNDDGSGNTFVTSTTNLRLNVIDPATGRLLATFPEPVEEGETPATWGNDTTPLTCTLNLNTVQMLKAVPPAANVPLLFVLDDYESKTLYFKDMCEVTHWPRRVGEEEPTNLDGYQDFVAEMEAAWETYKDGIDADLDAQDASIAALEESKADASDLTDHIGDTDNPHSVTKAQLGLGNVDNTSDANKPVSTATAESIAAAKSYAADLVSTEAVARASAVSALDAAKAAKATTLAGYGITDAKIENGVITLGGSSITPLTSHQSLDAYVNGATYSSEDKKIYLLNGSTVVAYIDATAFIKDGMVSSVEIDDGNLVITFNTDAGQEPIEIPLTDIFDPDNYYDKTAADGKFVAKEAGKGLSTEDYTTAEKTKLGGIAAGAQVNVIETVKVNGTALTPQDKAVNIPVPTLDNTVTPSSANGVKSSGIWSALWGALSALPTGFSSLYDWVVGQLARKQPSLSPGRIVAPDGVIKSVSAAVKYEGSTTLLRLLTENVAINGNAFTGDVTLTGADIAVSDTDATKIDAALAGKQSALSDVQLANIAAVPNKANASDLRYAISESMPLTVTSDAASTTLDDRTHNVRTVAAPGSGNTTTITATLPPIVQGKSRDMFINLTVGSAASDAGDISLSIVEPSGATVQIDIGSVEDIGIGKNEILISENALPTTSGNVTTTHWLVTVRHEDFAS